MATDLEALLKALAPLIGGAGIDDEQGGNAFCAAMRALVHFDYVVIFAYRNNERPIDLYSTFSAPEHTIFVSLYQAGPYLLDPFYHAAREAKSGLWRMRELAPDRFFSSEYYRSYYAQTGLAEEVGFFVGLEQGITVVLSLMRREATGVFSSSEFSLLRKMDPVVSRLVAYVWSGLDQRFDAALKGGRGSRKLIHPAADRVWRNLNLTQREASIIELVLQGHSSESIGLKLRISTGTVKVHRRNVYRKLGISSQTQLLAIYLKNFIQ